MADDASAVTGAETPADFGEGEGAVARRWIAELERSEKSQAKWIERGKKIQRIYREEERGGKRYAILWANIQTLAPAVYARTPTAVVGRRYKDDDVLGRIASQVLERALNFTIETTDFAEIMTGLRDDYLLVARGQAWVRYVPHMLAMPKAAAEPAAPAEGEQPPVPGAEAYAQAAGPAEQGSDGQVTDDPGCYDVVDWEEAIADHVNWKDFGTIPGDVRSWSEVRAPWRRAYLTREELIERFGKEIGEAVPLDWSEKDRGDSAAGAKDDLFAKAAVYEIWDKPSKTVFWVSRSYPTKVLDQREDPLKLKGFFPCPRPLLGTTGLDSLIPVPDYVYIQTQAEEINALTARIDKLADALKVRGWYAAFAKEQIDNLATAKDNELIPVESWTAFADKGGVDKLIVWMPVQQVAEVLRACIELRKQLIDDIYQITGIADIMRGDTDPNETKGAQVIKANWGSSRVRDRQKEMARFARDLISLMGQVIATRFSQETLSQMTDVKLLTREEKQQIQAVQALQEQQQTQAAHQAQAQWQAQAAQAQQQGQQPPPAPAPPEQPTPLPPEVQQQLSLPAWEDVMDLLRDNALRAFRIDVETDSTIEPNDQEEKQRRVEFVAAVGKFLAESLPVVQAAPQMLPVVVESLKFVVRGFRVGREMEDVIDRALDQLETAAQQPKPPPQPDPAEQLKAQAAATTAKASMITAQAEAQAAQTRAGAENLRSQTEAAVAQHETGLDLAQHHLDAQGQAHGQAVDEHQLMVDALRSIQQRELRRESLNHSVPNVGQP